MSAFAGSAGAAEPIASFEGTGDFVTERFEVAQDAWQVCWQTANPQMRVDLLDDTGEMQGIVTDSDRDGKGCAFYFSRGTYQLRTTVDGAWELTVEPM